MDLATCGATAAMEEARESWGEQLPKGAVLRTRHRGLSVSASPFDKAGQQWTPIDGPPATTQHHSDDDEEAGLG